MATVTDQAALTDQVRALVAERDAVLLAHNYQWGEVQDAADFVGDSLGLARQAAETDAAVIVFAGVHFMAETAKILAPDRTVLMPEPDAGCPMADMMTLKQAVAFKGAHPGVPLVTYVNSSAEVKTVTDVCCTSANAVQIVRSLGVPKVLFAPDRNLGAWVAAQLDDVEIVSYDGCCPIHDMVTAELVLTAKASHPGAAVIAHPECRPEVTAIADAVLSTSQMLRYAAGAEADTIIVVTEQGLLHGLRKAAPDKEFVGIATGMLCPNMKMTTLEKVRDCLRDLSGQIDVAPDVRSGALAAVERMVTLG